MLLPRMLISFASCGIVLVGNETLITSPPVKNGFTSCRSGDIMAIRHESRQSCGIGDQVVGVEILDRLERQVADQRRLLAGLDVQRLDVLERRLPVVALAHLARGLLHLVLAPGELLAGRARSAPRACTRSSRT